MKDIRRQQLALLPGVGLAVALPGITLGDADSNRFVGFLFAYVIFAGVSTAIWATPRDPRQGLLLPFLAVVGLAQDTLVWYLVTWISDVEVTSFWWALAGAFVVRAFCWAGVWFLPSEPEKPSA